MPVVRRARTREAGPVGAWPAAHRHRAPAHARARARPYMHDFFYRFVLNVLAALDRQASGVRGAQGSRACGATVTLTDRLLYLVQLWVRNKPKS